MMRPKLKSRPCVEAAWPLHLKWSWDTSFRFCKVERKATLEISSGLEQSLQAFSSLQKEVILIFT